MGIDELVKNLQKSLPNIQAASDQLKSFGANIGKLLESDSIPECDKQKLREAINLNPVNISDLDAKIQEAKDLMKNI
jgi:hypothetical protein